MQVNQPTPLTFVDVAMALNLSCNLSGNSDVLTMTDAVKVLLAPSPENTALTQSALMKTFQCTGGFVGIKCFLRTQEKQHVPVCACAWYGVPLCGYMCMYTE